MLLELYQDSFLTGYILVLSFLLGTVFGSFINCTAGRIAAGVSWLKGRSCCDSCGHVLAPIDLVPIWSWVFLRGRCRYCGAKVPARYMLTELGLGLAFIGIVLSRGGLSWLTVRDWALTVILLGLSLVDLEKYEIPDGFIIAGLAVWAITLPLVRMSGVNLGSYMTDGLVGGFGIAGGMLAIAMIMDRVLKKESLGGGDVKLLFMTGLYLGFAKSLLSLIVACIVGLVFVVSLKKQKIAFGPSISIAVYLTMILGSQVVSWYLGLF